MRNGGIGPQEESTGRKDYKLLPRGVLHVPTGTIIQRGDPGWPAYEAWLTVHVEPEPPDLQPVREYQFNFTAAGAARDQRILEKRAKTDPILKAVLDLKGK